MEIYFNPFEATHALSDQRMLFRDCFPETIGQPAAGDDHYFWKFHSFPAHPPSYEYGARMGADLIGYYAAIPYKYKIGDHACTAGMVCDVMTGSKARGKGIFTRLGAYSLDRMKEAGIDFTTGYPIRPEVLPGHLKVGWKVVERMPIYIKILRTDSILRQKKLGYLTFPGNAGAAAFNLVFRMNSRAREYAVETLAVDAIIKDAAYPRFLQKWLKQAPNALIKDGDFLSWRLGAPQTEYKIVVARDPSGEIMAMAIARHTILEKIPTLAVLDLMALPGHSQAIGSMDPSLRICARQTGSEIIATMISPRWAKAYGLSRLGYLKSPHVFSLIVKKLNDTLDDELVYRADRWHTMWIDSDDL